MNIAKELKNDELVVALEGRLDTVTAPELETSLKDELEPVKTLTFDFGKLEYVSSAGLRVLLSFQKLMMTKGKMIVKNVNDDVYEIFEMTGFTDFLTIEK